jgi:hypothetical protein
MAEKFGITNEGLPQYPPYLQDLHQAWLRGDGTLADAGDGTAFDTKNLMYYIGDLLDGTSPYSGVAAYDPDASIATWMDRIGHVNLAVDLFHQANTTGAGADSPGSVMLASGKTVGTGAWSVAMAEAKRIAGANIGGTTDVDALVTAYENDADARLSETLNLYTGSVFEARAMQSSQFAVGMAIIHSNRDKDVAAYRANLELRMKDQQNQFIAQATQSMVQSMFTYIDARRATTGLALDTGRAEIVAKKEELSEQIEIAMRDAYWEIDLLKEGMNNLGAVSGLMTIPPRQPKWLSALTGAMGGAATFAPLAMTGNPLGIAALGVGAVLGGLGGMAQGY